MYQLSTSGGKYLTTINDNDGSITIERYREPWRDVTGDNYILSLLHLIQEQQEKIKELQDR